MNRVTWIIIGIILVAFGGLAIWTINTKNQNAIDFSVYDTNGVIEFDENNGWIGDHVIGERDAEVIIVEYADFQCGGCATANTRVKKLVEEYDGKVAVVYRNFLMSYHQNGFAAASAAEAAGFQGRWEEMATALFSNQASWSSLTDTRRNDVFMSLFSEIDEGLDAEQFLKDMNEPDIKKKLDFDQEIAKRVGAPGTPSFFIDGEQISVGSNESEFLENMRKAIDAKLEKE